MKEELSKEVMEAGKEFYELKNRIIHPAGKFDNAGRWYPDVKNPSLDYIRSPSRSFPYSYMSHCRSAKRVAELRGIDEKLVRKAYRIIKKQEEEKEL